METTVHTIKEQMEHNIAAALLADPADTYDEIRPIIREQDFESPAARAIFTTVASMLSSGVPIDANLILNEASALDPCVDYQYCREAINVTPTLKNTVVYARAVHDKAVEKEEQEIGMKIAMGEISGIDAVSKLQDLTRSRGNTLLSPMDAANSMMDFINEMDAGKRKLFVPTGFDSLDSILSGGLVNCGLITLAARPGTGKTTAGICIAENIAASGTPVLYISLEMGFQQIWACRLANWSGQNRSEIYTGKYTSNKATAQNQKADIDKKKEAVCKAVEMLSTHPFYIRDKASSVEDIAREAASIPDIGLIVVDHIGLVKPPPEAAKSRYEIMTEISHKLKQLALNMKIPILALCQLNRASLERGDRKPTMADLRDSGAIEEDSDAVILLFRDADSQEPIQKVRFIIDKNRHGPVGFVDMKFFGSLSRITM